MKISITIPTYNCGKYIRRALDSILVQQSYFDKEIIVVDGSSNDDTIEILKSYGDKIRWISEKDNGQAHAINKGFKMSSGDVIGWLNADDYYEPDIFEQISREFIENDKLVLLYGNCRSIDEKDGEIKINIPQKNINYNKLIQNGNYIYQPASFYKKEAVVETDYLDDSLNYWMEYDLFIKLLKFGESKYVSKILANFTIREDQKSNKKNILEMDKELFEISKKYGGSMYSKVFISNLLRKIKYHLNI
ncbi:MAG: glycosyltransferase family 2 protein [Candidatus Shapirobacteria bacterium]|nr:glycosyltransferase family 2 protein [Candidatus Shapirobacteria bacterium]